VRLHEHEPPQLVVNRLLLDAEGERRHCGGTSSDATVLREHLVDALARVHQLENVPRCKLTEEQRREGHGCDLSPMCTECALAEAKTGRDCGMAASDRLAGNECESWGAEDLEKCAACQLAEAKREKDCGASHEEQANRKPCGLSSGYLDRCCACELAMKEAGHAEEMALAVKDLEAAKTAALPTDVKAADVIAALRTDLALANARRDCGASEEERETQEHCVRRDMPGGICDECFVSAMTRSVAKDCKARTEAATETLRRENDGLRNQLQIVTAERDNAIIQADRRPAAPAKPAKVTPVIVAAPSLFDRLTMPEQAPVEVPPKAKRKPRAGVKKYPLGA
jgi:hypothetical protein